MLVPRQADREGKLLKQRADYFFASNTRFQREVVDFLVLLLQLGPVVAIGGFLRDLYLSGSRNFKSDIDFVVDPSSTLEFERLMSLRGGRLNKFGGYGISLNRWKVDVWSLDRTWAARAGHVAVAQLDDLVDVTFFDWDAILYSVGRRRLIPGHSYFEKVRGRVIDINLEPNPNPLGNAVRAVRYAYRWDAAFGERLAQHVAAQIRNRGWTTLVDSERESFPNPILGRLNGEAIAATLRDHSSRAGGVVRLPLWPQQAEIDLVGGSYCQQPKKIYRNSPRRKATRLRDKFASSLFEE
jgi:hypothetical protein